MSGYGYVDHSKFNFMQGQQQQQQQHRPYKPDPKSSNNVLQAFDPLAPAPGRVSREASPSGSDNSKTFLKSSGGSTLGSSTQTLVPDSLLVSPDQGIASPGNDSGALSASPQSDHRDRDRDSGVPPTPQDSMDTLSSDVSEGLKLTEQQNVNIDANRLSGLSGVLNFLDPLLPDGASESFMARSRSSTEGSGIALLRNNPITRMLFNDQSPQRPRSASGAPRITVQANDVHSGSSKSRRGDRMASAPVGGEGNRLCDLDLLADHDHHDVMGHEEDKRHSDSSNLSSSDFFSKSRSSTESSSSSIVETTMASGGKTVGFDTPTKDDRVSSPLTAM